MLIDLYPCIYLNLPGYAFTDSIDAMLENIREENEISPSLNEIVKMIADPYRAATVAEDAWQDGVDGEDDDNDAGDVFNHVDPNEYQEGNYPDGGFDGTDDDFGMDPMPEPNPDLEDEEVSAILLLRVPLNSLSISSFRVMFSSVIDRQFSNHLPLHEPGLLMWYALSMCAFFIHICHLTVVCIECCQSAYKLVLLPGLPCPSLTATVFSQALSAKTLPQ
jgi:hypothetical protein